MYTDRITYGSEVLTLTKKYTTKLRVSQTIIEREILRITRSDVIRYRGLKERTKLTDIIKNIEQAKLGWAGK